MANVSKWTTSVIWVDRDIEITMEYPKINHSHQIHRENEKCGGICYAKSETTKDHAIGKPRSKTPNKTKVIRGCPLT